MAQGKEITGSRGEPVTDKDGWISYFVSAVPWAGCPFDIQMVVVTKNGREDAIRVFKEVYQNESLEVKNIHEISLVRADMWDEIKKELREKAN